MTVTIEIYQDYAELYGIDTAALPPPLAGESVLEYIARAGLGKEEDILAVVNGVSRSVSYILKDGDALKIYPLAASG